MKDKEHPKQYTIATKQQLILYFNLFYSRIFRLKRIVIKCFSHIIIVVKYTKWYSYIIHSDTP